MRKTIRATAKVMRVRAALVMQDPAVLHTTDRADQPIRVLEVRAMPVPAALDIQGLVVPRTRGQEGLFTLDLEVPHTMVQGGAPIQARGGRVTRGPEGLVIRARVEQGASVPLCANNTDAFCRMPEAGR